MLTVTEIPVEKQSWIIVYEFLWQSVHSKVLSRTLEILEYLVP